MAAYAKISPEMLLQAAAPTGTGNVLSLQLAADAAYAAVSDTLAQIQIEFDDAVSSDDQLVELRLMAAEVACTLDNTSDTVEDTAHGLENGQPIRLLGTLPTGLAVDTTYYVVNKTTDDFQVSLTVAGAAITFTTNGSGVTYRTVGSIVASYQYPTTGPAIAPIVRTPGTAPLDFSKVKAVQIVLRAQNTAADASGKVHLTMGDTTDRYGHFNLPLEIDFTADGEENWPSATLVLPVGLAYDTDYDLTCRCDAGLSNTNLLVLINLLGN